MADLRAAIIGCGNRAKGHVQGYREAAGVELVAVADVDCARADGFATDYGVPAYYDAAALLEQVKPDIVSVVTKPEGRSDLTCLCAEYGVRGIVAEKPMAITLEEADRMVAACDRAGTLLTVCHQMRYSREFELGKEALAAGEIGDPYFMRGVSYGNLMNQGTHVIDMIRWFANDARVAWVMAQTDDYDWPDRDRGHPAPMWTTGYLAFEGPEGLPLRATLEDGPRYVPAAGTKPGWLNKRVEVLGTGGMVDCVVGNYFQRFNADGTRREDVPPERGWSLATIRFIEDLARVLREGGQHRNHAATSVHSFEVIQALARSAHRGGIVELPLPRDDSDPLGELLAARGAEA